MKTILPLKIKIVLGALLLAWYLPGVVAQTNPPATLDQISRATSQARTIFTKFVQERHLSLFTEPLRSEGYLCFQKPGCVRWETTAPYKSILVSDGTGVAQFEWTDDHWKKLDLGLGDALQNVVSQIAGVMDGRYASDKNTYTVSVTNRADELVITLVPQNETVRKMMAAIEVHLAADLKGTRRVVLRETGGDYTDIQFTDQLVNLGLPPRTFDRTAPVDLEQIKAVAKPEAMTGRATLSMLLLVLPALLAGGCATPPRLAAPVIQRATGGEAAAFVRAEQTIQGLFPPHYRATQRAIVTAGGKQFTCDGLLQAAPADGLHLAIVSSFGVVTDLRVQADGRTELLKVTPLFREDWSRRFVARDLRWLFLPPTGLSPAGRLANGSLVLETAPDAAAVMARYVFSPDGTRWQQLDLLRAGKTFYRAVPKNFRPLTAGGQELPHAFEVTAEAYRLELRIAEMNVLQSEGQP